MKHILSIIVFFGVGCGLCAEEGFEPLFNGKDLSGWKSVRDQDVAGSGAFRVNDDDGAIHVYAGEEAGSEQKTDCLYTEKEYSHYVLKLEYKWLDKRFAPRVEHDRDAGVLFHLHDNFDEIWPSCLEMQLGESDASKLKDRYTTGDLWVIGEGAQVVTEKGEDGFYRAGGPYVEVGKTHKYENSYVSRGNEKSHGEWNEITLTVRGAEEAIFELNGKVLNRITQMTHVVDGVRVPLDKGPIALQAEYAELMYRNIRIKELDPPVKSTMKRVWKPGVDSEFEVGNQIRAWTIQDEGMDTIMDNMQTLCGVNSLYMVVVMHQEHRPFAAPEFPHNPARDFWEAEDSRVTFYPDMDRYGRVKPLLSDIEWIQETDWLQVMVDACRERGMAAGAEVSHYPIPKSMIAANPDWQQIKIDGESWSDSRFCPNNPEVREYVIALFGDLAENYDLDYIQTCQHLFWYNDIDDGGTCFCKYCIEEAKKEGFDLEAAIPVLAADKNAQPERALWRRFRADSTTRFYKDIAEEIERVKMNPNCHLRYNDTYPYRRGEWDPRDLSMHIDEVAKYLGSIVTQDHQEQEGYEYETFGRRKRWLRTDREYVGPDMPLICGIAPRIKATPELVRKGIKVALEHPANVNGLAFKHYDGASFGLMRAFKQGMIEAGVEGLTPTIGVEVEDMELDNFERIDDFVEEWGVATSGEATATCTFDQPSGRYDVRITYFDGEKEQSKVQLLVNGKKAISFKLDEEADCWRWRRFDNITIKQGDEIKLVVKAIGEEPARLDFIEFIARK